MSTIATALKHMLAAGMPHDAIVAAVAEMEESSGATPARTARQERNARYYRNKTVLKRLNSDDQDVSDAFPPKKEIPPTPPKEKTTPLTEPNGSGVVVTRAHDLAEFKAELSGLDPERIEAIIKHRRSKHGQLTGLSARLFRRDAEACGLSLPDAVDTCISRNWITVKPEFLAGRPQRSRAPPRERSVSDALGEMAAGTWEPPDNQHEPTIIETSFHRRNQH